MQSSKEYALELFNAHSGDYHSALSDLFASARHADFKTANRFWFADVVLELNELCGIGTLSGT